MFLAMVDDLLTGLMIGIIALQADAHSVAMRKASCLPLCPGGATCRGIDGYEDLAAWCYRCASVAITADWNRFLRLGVLSNLRFLGQVT